MLSNYSQTKNRNSYTTILTILSGTHINRFIAVSSATYFWTLSMSSTKDFISSSPCVDRNFDLSLAFCR